MRVKLLKDCDTPQGKRKAGAEIDHKDAYHLVRMKVAKAVDDEAIAMLKTVFGLNSNGDPLPAGTPRGAEPKPEAAPEKRPAPPPPVQATPAVETPKDVSLKKK